MIVDLYAGKPRSEQDLPLRLRSSAYQFYSNEGVNGCPHTPVAGGCYPSPAPGHCPVHGCERLNWAHGSATGSDDVVVRHGTPQPPSSQSHMQQPTRDELRPRRPRPDGELIAVPLQDEVVLAQTVGASPDPDVTDDWPDDATVSTVVDGQPVPLTADRPVVQPPHYTQVVEFQSRAEFRRVIHQSRVRPEPGMRSLPVARRWEAAWARKSLAGGWPNGSYTGSDDMPRKQRAVSNGEYRAPKNATQADVEKLIQARLASGSTPVALATEVSKVVRSSAVLRGITSAEQSSRARPSPSDKKKQRTPRAPRQEVTASHATRTMKSAASAALQFAGVPGVAANSLVDMGESVYHYLRNALTVKGKGDYVVTNYSEGTSAAENPNSFLPHRSQEVRGSSMQGERFTARMPFGAIVAPATGAVGTFSIDMNPANVRDERIASYAAVFRRFRVLGFVVNYVSDVSPYATSGVKPAMAMGCDASCVLTATPASIWQVNEMASSVYSAADKDILFGAECSPTQDTLYLMDDGTGLHPPEALRPAVVWGAYTGGAITAGTEMGQLFVYVDYEFTEPIVPAVPYGALKAYSNTNVANSTPFGTAWSVRVYAGVGTVLFTSTTMTFLTVAPGTTWIVYLMWWGGSAAVNWNTIPALTNAVEAKVLKYTTAYQQGISCFPPNATTSTNYLIAIPMTASASVGPTQYPVVTLSNAMTLPTSAYLDVIVAPLSSSSNTAFI